MDVTIINRRQYLAAIISGPFIRDMGGASMYMITSVYFKSNKWNLKVLSILYPCMNSAKLVYTWILKRNLSVLMLVFKFTNFFALILLAMYPNRQSAVICAMFAMWFYRTEFEVPYILRAAYPNIETRLGAAFTAVNCQVLGYALASFIIGFFIR